MSMDNREKNLVDLFDPYWYDWFYGDDFYWRQWYELEHDYDSEVSR